jgi:hypothetical protein
MGLQQDYCALLIKKRFELIYLVGAAQAANASFWLRSPGDPVRYFFGLGGPTSLKNSSFSFSKN